MIRILLFGLLACISVIGQSQSTDPFKETAKLKKGATHIMVLTHDSLHVAFRKMRRTAEQLGFTVNHADSNRRIILISNTTKEKDPLQSRIRIRFVKEPVLSKIFLDGEALNYKLIQTAINGGPKSYEARRCFVQLYVLASRYGTGVISAGTGRPLELYPHIRKGVNGVVLRTGMNLAANMQLIDSVANRHHIYDVIRPSDNARSGILNEDYHREGNQWLSWAGYVPSGEASRPSYRVLVQARDSLILITGTLDYESEASRDFFSGLTGATFYKSVPIVNPWEEDYKLLSYSNPRRELNYLQSAFSELLDIADWFMPYPVDYVTLPYKERTGTK